MELCNKKNNDGLWMDEIAAMQGFLLAGEDNDHSREFMINVHNGGLSGGKQNGSIDAASDSTLSHGSLETNQGMVERPCFFLPLHFLQIVIPFAELPKNIRPLICFSCFFSFSLLRG